MKQSARYQGGLSLIESMIAVLVTSIGLLGVAALQATALRENNSAYWNSQAVLLAVDMADRIRANSGQFNNYNGVDTSKDYDQDCIQNTCRPQQLLASDAADWSSALEVLPAGRGVISSPRANTLRVRVMWDDDGTGATGIACGNNTSVDLSCYIVEISQ